MEQTYIKSNLHTHSLFCDGIHSLSENAENALKKGFRVLGFSSHSVYPFWTECNMKCENFSLYCDEIRRLQKELSGQLVIRLGFEADYIPGITVPRFDTYSEFAPEYLIGSVHFVFHRDGIIAVDHSPQMFRTALENRYGGNIRAFVCDYFAAEREMLEHGDFSILGHPDLIRKFNEKNHFFDENEAWYKREIESTASAVARSGVAVEINTGAISRGYMTDAYPSDYFLALLHEHNVPIVINSDAHSAEQLDCAFELALSKAKKAGFTEIVYDVSASGFLFCKI